MKFKRIVSFCLLSLAGIVGCILFTTQEAYTGTYGGVSKVYRGFTVSINTSIGRMTGGNESEVMQNRKEDAEQTITKDEPRLQKMFIHFIRDSHPFRKYDGYLNLEGPNERTYEGISMFENRMTVVLHFLPETPFLVAQKLETSYLLSQLSTGGDILDQKDEELVKGNSCKEVAGTIEMLQYSNSSFNDYNKLRFLYLLLEKLREVAQGKCAYESGIAEDKVLAKNLIEVRAQIILAALEQKRLNENVYTKIKALDGLNRYYMLEFIYITISDPVFEETRKKLLTFIEDNHLLSQKENEAVKFSELIQALET